MADNFWTSGVTAADAPVPHKFHSPEVHNLGDLLDWQRAALQEGIFKKGSSDANRAALRDWLAKISPAKAAALHLLGPLGFLVDGAKRYGEMNHAEQGAYDMALDTSVDPLTIETADAGQLVKGAARLLSPAARLAAKIPGVEAAGKATLPILNAARNTVVRAFNHGGNAIIEHGQSAANEAIGRANRAESETHELNRLLQQHNTDIMRGLNPKQTSAVQKIMHGQLPDDVVARIYAQDPAIEQAVTKRRDLTDAVLRLQQAPGGGVEEALTELRGGKLPDLPADLQHFAGRPGPFMRHNIRANYFPARGEAKAVAEDAPEQTFNLLDTYNPHIKEQGEFHIPSKNVQHFEDAFSGMLKTAARNVSANRVRNELETMYGGKVPQAIKDLLDVKIPAEGAERSDKQVLQEFVKGVVGLPKIGIVGTSPIHMFNILALLAAHAPDAIPGAVKEFSNIVRAGGLKQVIGHANEQQRFAAMLPAIERGIDISTAEKGGALLSKSPLNRLTWDWDAAAKKALSDKYIKRGFSPIDAGVRAANDLVNYRNTSPATAALRYFMPFATFAEGGAKAILAATVRNPLQMEMLNRATGGTFLGGGDPKKDVTTYQPPADVGRGPYKYIRSKTSDLVKLPLALAADAVPGGKGKQLGNWILSGRTPAQAGLDIVSGPIPLARDILDMVPLPGGKTARGYDPTPVGNESLFFGTGVSLPHKPAAHSIGTPPPADTGSNFWTSGIAPTTSAPLHPPKPAASASPTTNFWTQ